MKELIAVVRRFVRVALGQLVGVVASHLLATYGGVVIPLFGITVGAAVSALFKGLRERFVATKYPKTAAFLAMLPL